MILHTNEPVPEPLVILLSAVVGLAEVLQHIPRSVTVAPPLLDILPPLLAVVAVIKEAEVVVRVAISGLAAKEISLP